jgi:hypothetical protein
VGKTRKDHKCELCGKTIPKGTPADRIVIRADGGRRFHRHTLGSHHGAYSYWGFRKYYHKDCMLILELCGRKTWAHGHFFVQRSAIEVVYVIGEHVLVVPLARKGIDEWNKAVEKYNKICEFARVNGLTMWPELSLTRLQPVDKVEAL